MNIIYTAAKLIMARTDAYLADMGTKDSFAAYPMLWDAVSELSEKELKLWVRILEEKDGGTEPDGHSPEGRYLRAVELLNRESVLQTLMELCAAEFLYPEFSAYLEDHFGYGPCLHLAGMLEGRKTLSYSEVHRYASYVRRILSLDMKSEPLSYTRVSADERLIGFLSGEDEISVKLSDIAHLFAADEELNEPYVNNDIIERGLSHFRDGGKSVCLTGSGGRRFIAKHIARGLGRSFLFINIADLLRAGGDDLSSLRDTLIREAYFSEAGICLYGFSERFITGGNPDRERRRRDMEVLSGMLFAPVEREDIPLILCADEPRLMPLRGTLPGLKILSLPSSYDFEERKRLWQGLFSQNALSFDPSYFASRYRMDPKEAAQAVAGYMEEYPGGLPDDTEDAGTRSKEELFARTSIERIRNTDSGVGRIVYSDVKLDDVKLKDNVKRVLTDAVNAILYGPVVLDEWGLRKNYPYGRGVSLLLAGPPGTGKTMSANAIAGELSLPLYQVNLSNVVDKYIGETEKNLEKAFLFAEKNNAILFFDEADALFGTRSEVHDSKDRYANTEISYLLQRMEAYDGIVVMATNIKGNIDPAFMRRIRFVAHFENPDEEMRRAIWLSCFTENVPCGDIDTDYLVTQFDKFTGSMIKTVFLNACALAAAEQEKLTMRHLVYAIKQETEKESAVGFTADTLGKYAYLV